MDDVLLFKTSLFSILEHLLFLSLTLLFYYRFCWPENKHFGLCSKELFEGWSIRRKNKKVLCITLEICMYVYWENFHLNWKICSLSSKQIFPDFKIIRTSIKYIFPSLLRFACVFFISLNKYMDCTNTIISVVSLTSSN